MLGFWEWEPPDPGDDVTLGYGDIDDGQDDDDGLGAITWARLGGELYIELHLLWRCGHGGIHIGSLHSN